jgi:hypothetical protein
MACVVLAEVEAPEQRTSAWASVPCPILPAQTALRSRVCSVGARRAAGAAARGRRSTVTPVAPHATPLRDGKAKTVNASHKNQRINEKIHMGRRSDVRGRVTRRAARATTLLLHGKLRHSFSTVDASETTDETRPAPRRPAPSLLSMQAYCRLQLHERCARADRRSPERVLPAEEGLQDHSEESSRCPRAHASHTQTPCSSTITTRDTSASVSSRRAKRSMP